MTQNVYDDPAFFAGYSAMPRSEGGLAEAGEWQALRAMLPALAGKRVLDLGCGFGWHCRHAHEQGASSVLGVDVSLRMLERAHAMTAAGTGIVYRQAAIEELDLPDASFDVVLSSLALHYVSDLDPAFAAMHRWLVAGGRLVFSVEHPVFTARAEQGWHIAPDGSRQHWPLDHYQDEGPRHVRWMGSDVVKYHRTLATWLNTLMAAGFRLDSLAEPQPPAEMVARRPALVDESRRPIFLMVAATRC